MVAPVFFWVSRRNPARIARNRPIGAQIDHVGGFWSCQRLRIARTKRRNARSKLVSAQRGQLDLLSSAHNDGDSWRIVAQ